MADKLKSLILAAGQGSRLRPLTSDCPKPLLPVFGIPLLELTSHKIKKEVAIEGQAVNAFYLKEKIAEFCESHQLHCSIEKDRVDTGGAVALLKPWVGGGALIIHSGDVISEMDLTALANAHRASEALATIYVVPHVAGETAINVKDSKLKGFGSGEFTFANAYILSPDFLAQIPAGKSGIIETFKKILADGGHIQALVWEGYWKNLNKVEDYVALHRDVLSKPGLFNSLYIDERIQKRGGRSRVESTRFLPESFDRQGHQAGDFVVLHDSPTLTAPATLERCMIMPGTVTSQSAIKDQILSRQYSIDIAGMWDL